MPSEASSFFEDSGWLSPFSFFYKTPKIKGAFSLIFLSEEY